jgi:hypothetical protein
MTTCLYTLPANRYSSTVAGVYVSYNEETLRNVCNSDNLELKSLLEDTAVSAVLSRGFSLVLIRYRTTFSDNSSCPNIYYQIYALHYNYQQSG